MLMLNVSNVIRLMYLMAKITIKLLYFCVLFV
nr:MAG TPA: hypothetical protein [Caudoviricetes sp.]